MSLWTVTQLRIQKGRDLNNFLIRGMNEGVNNVWGFQPKPLISILYWQHGIEVSGIYPVIRPHEALRYIIVNVFQYQYILHLNDSQHNNKFSSYSNEIASVMTTSTERSIQQKYCKLKKNMKRKINIALTKMTCLAISKPVTSIVHNISLPAVT